MIDFQDRLGDYIDSLNLPIPLFNEINSEEDSLSLYSLPGSQVVKGYMDGTKDKLLNYEIQGKARKVKRTEVLDTMALIGEKLEEIEQLPSKNNSYEFNRITVASEPFFNEFTTDGFIYFVVTFQALITIHKESDK